MHPLQCPSHLQPGTLVRHYKGGLYRIEGVCLIEATLEVGLLYRPQQGDAMDVLWMRPAHAFDEWVDAPQGRVRRFESFTSVRAPVLPPRPADL